MPKCPAESEMTHFAGTTLSGKGAQQKEGGKDENSVHHQVGTRVYCRRYVGTVHSRYLLLGTCK
jgi:hypothetical protein